MGRQQEGLACSLTGAEQEVAGGARATEGDVAEGVSLPGADTENLSAGEKPAPAEGRRTGFLSEAANDLRGSRTAVISQIRWQVTATDVPNICGELITH